MQKRKMGEKVEEKKMKENKNIIKFDMLFLFSSSNHFYLF